GFVPHAFRGQRDSSPPLRFGSEWQPISFSLTEHYWPKRIRVFRDGRVIMTGAMAEIPAA
ncbi:MAG: hypothetical protein KAR36_07290, partial [Candidatus Latescibacteria bacterium]|nr:hypothetical protein [Candidatus Latescibacterota bacterium]